MKKRIHGKPTQLAKRTLSLVLALTLFVTGMPISAFAAAAQEFRAPVSAPLGQPAPVDYEAMLGLKENAADSTGEMAADDPVESSPPARSTASLSRCQSMPASTHAVPVRAASLHTMRNPVRNILPSSAAFRTPTPTKTGRSSPSTTPSSSPGKTASPPMKTLRTTCSSNCPRPLPRRRPDSDAR